jgi:hypothetical protein
MQRRLTDDERKQVRRSYDALYSLHVYVSGRVELAEKLLAMITHNTTDGLPYVEPPLTDEDARQRPWVMVRDCEDHEWSGPRKLAAVTPQAKTKCYYILSNDGKTITTWDRCRRATLAELVGAGLEVTE